ncbi:MAG: Na(+)-translocating NADH-quinone reductase subunit A [Bacteroidales bacterium]|nr:Na(+)-translocating NADH-quinone reductase subunit A [Bacteroidales bacterium]
MSERIKIRKGLDIKICGNPERFYQPIKKNNRYAIIPTDYVGLTLKLLVEEGQRVKVGTPVLADKNNENIKITSPVSGVVVSINRGERRKLLEIVIESDETLEFETFTSGKPSDFSEEQIKSNLLQSGLWVAIKQRPYAIIANPKDKPKSIFISAFDSSPLAPDYNFIIKDNKKSFQTGIDILSKLTSGKVNLNLHDKFENSSFTDCKNVVVNTFSGPHPAGNVGIQIHHIDPINKGEIVWVVNVQDVVQIGKLFEEGKYLAQKVIAITGSLVKKPAYLNITSGIALPAVLADNLKEGNPRVISGNVLTGNKTTVSGFLGFYDSQITVIEEGDEPEFFGWATPGFNKHSASRAFWSWLAPKKEFSLNTNYHGGVRPFVFTGVYEKVLPMDIYPMQLLKAIIVEDIDKMEQLGIYEVAEEDFALCEYVCPSKIEIQSLIRKGLDQIRKEFS